MLLNEMRLYRKIQEKQYIVLKFLVFGSYRQKIFGAHGL